MPRLFRFLGSVFLSLASVVHAAPDQARTDQVEVRLFASVDQARPGERITLGLQQKIIPHWHTYWQNPGDSGLATTIAWELPPGARAEPIQWPTPSRFSIGPITNYGYDKEVTLLSAIQLPDNAVPGSQFPVKAKVNWLVCEEICIPQEATLQLRLPVAATSRVNPDHQHLIDQAAARLPVDSPWPIRFEPGPAGPSLWIESKALHGAQIQDIWFYAAEWGKVAHNAEQPRRLEGDSVVLQLQPGEAPGSANEPLRGVLAVTESTADGVITRGFSVGPAVVAAVQVTTAPPAPESGASGSLGLMAALLLALLGGLILNLMPCVFPILSIKALSLLQHQEYSNRSIRLQGLAYSGGVLASFAVLGAVLIALKAGGNQIGWGFQFQSPLFVLVMAYLMFAVGLSLSGVFSIGTSITGLGSSLTQGSGYAGSFFTGVLAALVATPCTAPFMGAAIGFALAQSASVLMAVFLSLGLGLALPYLLLSLWPLLQRGLPKPGPWMERIKQLLAFPMYGAAVWLVWVLAQQAGVDAVALALAGMVALAFAAWLYQTARHGSTLARHGTTGAAVLTLALILTGSVLALRQDPIPASATAAPAQAGGTGSGLGEAYSPERLQALRNEGRPVFVNFTAAWCITCLVNERVALGQQSVREAMQASGITYLKADWTSQDPRITRALAEFGRSGVPLYVFYPQGIGSKPVVLPQILTPDLVRSAFNAPSLSPAVPAVSPALSSTVSFIPKE